MAAGAVLCNPRRGVLDRAERCRRGRAVCVSHFTMRAIKAFRAAYIIIYIINHSNYKNNNYVYIMPDLHAVYILLYTASRAFLNENENNGASKHIYKGVSNNRNTRHDVIRFTVYTTTTGGVQASLQATPIGCPTSKMPTMTRWTAWSLQLMAGWCTVDSVGHRNFPTSASHRVSMPLLSLMIYESYYRSWPPFLPYSHFLIHSV